MTIPEYTEELLMIFNSQEPVLFHDDQDDPYARIPIRTHKEIWPMRSEEFKGYLERLYHEDGTDLAIPKEALKRALNILIARAKFDGPMHPLYCRVARHEDAIYYDLTDAEWRAVKITSDGWEIVNEPPILFRRFKHQQAQVEPKHGGSVLKFLNHVNVRTEDDKLLMPVYLVTSFIPGYPHPVLNLLGEQGSCKSTCSRFIATLVDPGKPPLLTLYNKINEIVLQLWRRHMAFFDNIGEIANDVSDLLCRAVTGDGYSKRKLFTDSEDIILDYRTVIGINGINLAVRKADLLDRCIFVELERVPEHERRPERLVKASFEQDRPYIMGGIFDAIVKAMQIKEKLIIPKLPRMADFAEWGCAVALALGFTQESFLSMYHNNMLRQDDEVIDASSIAQALIAFMEQRTEWKGNATDLLKCLDRIADLRRIDTRSFEWPRSASHLTRRLNLVKTNLSHFGISFKIRRGTHGKREIELLRTVESVATSATGMELGANKSPEHGGVTGGDEATSPPMKRVPPRKKGMGGGGGGPSIDPNTGEIVSKF